MAQTCPVSRLEGDPVREVEAAFLATPRGQFLSSAQRGHADLNQPLPIGHGQMNSQPSLVRRMLKLLCVRPGNHVLDVGAGSAWTTALLAFLVGPEGSVVGVELELALVAWGQANLAATDRGWARIETARPGVLGWPDEQPYDRILVSAEAPAVPGELLAQLASCGVMVVPVAGRLLRLRETKGARVVVEQFGHCRFVPLR